MARRAKPTPVIDDHPISRYTDSYLIVHRTRPSGLIDSFDPKAANFFWWRLLYNGVGVEYNFFNLGKVKVTELRVEEIEDVPNLYVTFATA